MTRAISGVVYVFLFIAAILFNEISYTILIVVFGGICLWEFSRLIDSKNIFSFILFPATIYYFTYHITEKQILIVSGLTFLCYIRLMYHLYSGEKKKYPVTFFGKLDMSIRYIIFPFSFLSLIPVASGEYESKIIISILVFIWVNDSFAYIVGSNFGKNKLFEQVSPKKTTEGFFGGWAFTLIAAYIVSVYYYTESTIELMDWMLIASVISIFGTVGDLVESKFKRQANKKDSGTIMPGHGGLLDRLDSLYYIAPFVYLYFHYVI